MCLSVCTCALDPWRPKEASDSLELELQVVESNLMWVLGTEVGALLKSSAHLIIGPSLQSLSYCIFRSVLCPQIN